MANESIKMIPYKSLTSIKSPYVHDSRCIYHVYINVMDLPEGLPTEVNPRDVNTKKKVYKKIVAGLTDESDNFFVNNRGILISAKSVKVDTLNKTLLLNVGENNDHDHSLYGVLDGGHSYDAIINHRSEIKDDDVQYVHLEIMTNVHNIDNLAEARNTSAQVSDKAIAELADKFEFVKEAIKNEPYANNISYRENEDKDLDSVDLVRLMFAFNVFKYPNTSTSQPLSAYTSKAMVLKDYLNKYDSSNNEYTQIALILPKIIRLYNVIEKEMADAYKDVNPKGSFGKVKGIEVKNNNYTTKYFNQPNSYQISQGFIFPILAAFRALLDEEKGTLYWSVDPIDVWKKVRGKLVSNTINMSRTLGNNPQSTGKNSNLWSQNFDAVNMAKMEIMIENMKNK